MPIPTVSKITPNFGPTRGRRLVQIMGTNFQLPPPPPPTGRVPVANPSVRVLFGTVEADRVDVLTHGQLHVLTPAHDPGACDVTVQNIAQDGTVIGSEQVVVANGYTFKLPDLTARGINESTLAYVVRILLQELKRQVHPNVSLTVAVDYDDSPGDNANIAMLATLPGLVLAGPRLRENRNHSVNQLREDMLPAQSFNDQTQARPGYTVDVVFTVIGAMDNAQMALNFQQEVTSFFHQNRLLRVPNPADATETVDFEMVIEEPPSAVGSANSSNIHAFSGTVAVLGVTLDDDDMAIRGLWPIDDVLIGGSDGIVVEPFNPDDQE